MAQVKVYGLKESLNPIKQKLSDVIHNTVVEVLEFPQDKRFHRFFAMQREDFIFPSSKSSNYIIIEITLIKGRRKESLKKLINLLFANISKELNIATNDIEIVIQEFEAHCFGFRGLCADEIELDYKVKV